MNKKKKKEKQSIEVGEFPESWKTSSIALIERVLKTIKYEKLTPVNALKTLEKK